MCSDRVRSLRAFLYLHTIGHRLYALNRTAVLDVGKEALSIGGIAQFAPSYVLECQLLGEIGDSAVLAFKIRNGIEGRYAVGGIVEGDDLS